MKPELMLHFTNVLLPWANVNFFLWWLCKGRGQLMGSPLSSVTTSWVSRTLINKSDTHISSRELDSEEDLLTHEKQFLLGWYFNQNWSRMIWPGPWIWVDIKSVKGAVAVSQGLNALQSVHVQLLTQGSFNHCSYRQTPWGQGDTSFSTVTCHKLGDTNHPTGCVSAAEPPSLLPGVTLQD